MLLTAFIRRLVSPRWFLPVVLVTMTYSLRLFYSQRMTSVTTSQLESESQTNVLDIGYDGVLGNAMTNVITSQFDSDVGKHKAASQLGVLDNGLDGVLDDINSVSAGRKDLEFTRPLNFSIDEFYATDLVEHTEEANKLSPLLTTNEAVIAEAERVHLNILSKVLGKYKYAMLFLYEPSENRGDSAIVVGETYILRKLNIEIIFACPWHCGEDSIQNATKISTMYSEDELVILFTGGGNVVGYAVVDYDRAKVIRRFKKFNIVMFPQGILYKETEKHIEYCKELYSSHDKMTFLWRDRGSFDLGKKLFPKVRSLLAPDIAFAIGPVKRFMPPAVDILWMKRQDKEKAFYEIPHSPENYTMRLTDWMKWHSPGGKSNMEDSFLRTTTGLMYLQRGRVVVTDRLHGHILSTLLNIPHVLIDNDQQKISKYVKTWTSGLKNVRFAKSGPDAMLHAVGLLKTYENTLPVIKGFYSNTG